MAEELLESVLDQLKPCTVAQLGEICVVLDLNIPLQKAGKQGPIRNLIRNHLTSDEVENSDDNGLELITAVDTRLKALLGNTAKEEVKEEVKPEDPKEETSEQKRDTGGGTSHTHKIDTGGGTSHTHTATGNGIDGSRVVMARLKDFKIKGGVVGLEKDSLDYVSLSYQITEGKKLGHSMQEIRAGVVDAMKGELRKYFEGNASMSDEDFLGILHSKYEVSNAITIFNEMTNAAQEPKETASKFTMRLMNMRDLIIALGREGNEEIPVDEVIARKAFFHTLTIGYHKDTVRLHLHNYLKTEPCDRKLLEEVRKVVTLEKEHEKKLRGGSGVNAQVSSVDVGREDKILLALTKINSKLDKIDEMDKKLEELEKYTKREIEALKNQVMAGGAAGAGGVAGGGNAGTAPLNNILRHHNDNNNNNNNNNRNRVRFVKCENCTRTNAFCIHCTKCGEEGHKRFQCPLNE